MVASKQFFYSFLSSFFTGIDLIIHVDEIISKLMDIVSEQYSNPILRFIALWRFRERSWFYDTRYKLPTLKELEDTIDEWKKNVLPHKHYETDFYDCDDYASDFHCFARNKLNSNAIGLALGILCTPSNECGGHAWSFAVINWNNEPAIVMIEPQLGEILQYNYKRHRYMSSDGFIYTLLAVII